MKSEIRSYPNERNVKSASCLLSGLVFLVLFQPTIAFAGGVVTNCTETALRAAMTGGGTVTFACDGTITLTSTITNDLDCVLDGSRHT